MLLMHRLFMHYPARELLVFETTRSDGRLRLPDLTYQQLFPPLFRLMRTRLRKYATVLAWVLSMPLSILLARRLRKSGVAGIVTVSHGITWLIAARVAEKLGLPLHMVNHDYWKDSIEAPAFVMSRLEQHFARAYRTSRVRFCVSPYMETYYRALYDAPGNVLYPGRCAAIDSSIESTSGSSKSFRIGYAGSLSRPGFIAILQCVADDLLEVGGSLVVFSPMAPLEIHAKGLVGQNVLFQGNVPSDFMVPRLRGACDALLLPMSNAMGVNARISFPSKLVDYTATGLPIIIVGPPDCSAVQWANETDAGIVVDEADREGLRLSIRMLAGNPDLRQTIGRKLMAAGESYFSHEQTAGLFMRSLKEVTGQN